MLWLGRAAVATTLPPCPIPPALVEDVFDRLPTLDAETRVGSILELVRTLLATHHVFAWQYYGVGRSFVTDAAFVIDRHWRLALGTIVTLTIIVVVAIAEYNHIPVHVAGGWRRWTRAFAWRFRRFRRFRRFWRFLGCWFLEIAVKCVTDASL